MTLASNNKYFKIAIKYNIICLYTHIFFLALGIESQAFGLNYILRLKNKTKQKKKFETRFFKVIQGVFKISILLSQLPHISIVKLALSVFNSHSQCQFQNLFPCPAVQLCPD